MNIKHMKTAFIVQARTGSTRLPNKILLPFFNNKCILELLIEKLSIIQNVETIIATSLNGNNDVIENFCNIHGVKCFRGNENDVLQRFIDAAETFDIAKIIRVCSDNPFLELESIKELVRRCVISDADYISFNINGTPSIKTHYGFWTEYTTLEALHKVKRLTQDRLYHEHVTNFIYTHPQHFSAEWIDGPECLINHSDIRLTCDTIEDFQCCKEIYSSLCIRNPYPTIQDIVHYLDYHKEYSSKMSRQIIINSK